MISFNHIGIAVQDLSGLKNLFSFLELEVNHTEPVPEQGVVTHFIPLPLVQGNIELLETTDDQGTVAQFIKKKGPGIHHISFKVEKGQLDALSIRLRAGGYRLIYENARRGAHGMKINFIHPASAGGILIELMEQE